MPADVFVSYARKDREAVLAWVRQLQDQGVSVWMDERGIDGAVLWGQEIVEAIEGCKLLLLMVSSSSAASRNVLKEVALAGEGNKPILPLLLEPVQIPTALRFHLAGVHQIDLFRGDPDEQLAAILRSMVRWGVRTSDPAGAEGPEAVAPARRKRQDRNPPDLDRHEPQAHAGGVNPAPAAIPGETAARVALLYKRHAQPDERLLQVLETRLEQEGHPVFIDRHLSIGVEWAKEIERQVRAADAVVPLLSATSVHSEMLQYEVQTARDAAQDRGGKPRILPVRVQFSAPLPEPLAAILNPLHYKLWEGPQDDERLAGELLDALRSPPPLAPEKLESAGGVVPLDSEFYVVRPTDDLFRAAIERRESIVLVKGARQMGKTSLLARGLQHARLAGARTLTTDFQMLNAAHLQSVDSLLLALGGWIADLLDIDVAPEDVWNPRRGPSINFQRYLQREILSQIPEPVVWGLDEVDRLFSCDFGSEVFGMFRSWHNARYLDPTGPWNRLTLAIAYATEAHLFITDVNQSPFNVGTRLPLADFTYEQVADLNQRHRAPLRNAAEVESFYRLLGGQPYLVRRGLLEMVTQAMEFPALEAQADRDEGIFGDHLRRIFVLLVKDAELCDAIRGVLQGQPCPPEAFYRLRSAGVLTGDSARDARLRCRLYATYLERHLL